LPACATNVATFISGSNPANERVHRAGEAYSVHWNTKAAGLQVNGRYRVRVYVETQLLGFFDFEVVSKRGRPSAVSAGFLRLRQGHPLVIRFRIENGALDETSALKLAFLSDRDNSNFIQKIYVMNADGSGVKQLTQEGREFTLAWSPDGTRIAFIRSVLTNFMPELFVMNADGSGQTRLTNNLGFGGVPAWSPDGSRLALNGRGPAGDAEIFVINADGSSLTKLTNDPGLDESPAWSPNGDRIAFARHIIQGGRSVSNIYVMNPDGTGQVKLTNPAIPGREFRPLWAPDGSKILFERRLFVNAQIEIGDIYTINPDGSGETKLTNSPITDFTQGAGGAVWSPDGSRIAFSSDSPTTPPSDLFVMNRDGSGITNITNTAERGENRPAWSPDGSKIAFSSLVDNKFDIFVLNPDGSGVANITHNSAQDIEYVWKP
jgi:TolB protein